jgi:hypothetical protein
MRLVPDSGADLSLSKHCSIKESTVYYAARSVNVKGTANIRKDIRAVVFKFSTEDPETGPKFQIVGVGIISHMIKFWEKIISKK